MWFRNRSALAEKRLDLTRWKFDPEKQDAVLSLGIMPVSAKVSNEINALTPGGLLKKPVYNQGTGSLK